MLTPPPFGWEDPSPASLLAELSKIYPPSVTFALSPASLPESDVYIPPTDRIPDPPALSNGDSTASTDPDLSLHAPRPKWGSDDFLWSQWVQEETSDVDVNSFTHLSTAVDGGGAVFPPPSLDSAGSSGSSTASPCTPPLQEADQWTHGSFVTAPSFYSTPALCPMPLDPPFHQPPYATTTDRSNSLPEIYSSLPTPILGLYHHCPLPQSDTFVHYPYYLPPFPRAPAPATCTPPSYSTPWTSRAPSRFIYVDKSRRHKAALLSTSLPRYLSRSTPLCLRPPGQVPSRCLTPVSKPGLSRRSYSSASSTFPPDSPRKRKRSVGEDSPGQGEAQATPKRSTLHPPKQAPTVWQIFFTDWLERRKTRDDDDRKLNVAQAAKEAGLLYNKLSEEERDALKRRAAALKEKYEREFTAWKRTLTPADIARENAFRAAQRKSGKSRRKNINDPNAPKRPLSAYFMFLQAIRGDPQMVKEVFGEEIETTRQSVLAATKWRSMNDAEKKPYFDQAEDAKLEYEAVRKVYDEQTRASHEYAVTSVLVHPPSPSPLSPRAVHGGGGDGGDVSSSDSNI